MGCSGRSRFSWVLVAGNYVEYQITSGGTRMIKITVILVALLAVVNANWLVDSLARNGWDEFKVSGVHS